MTMYKNNTALQKATGPQDCSVCVIEKFKAAQCRRKALLWGQKPSFDTSSFTDSLCDSGQVSPYVKQG